VRRGPAARPVPIPGEGTLTSTTRTHRAAPFPVRRSFPCPSCASGDRCAPSRSGPHAARQTREPARFPARQPVRGRVRFPAETGMTGRPVNPQAVAGLNIPVDSKTDTAPRAVKTIWGAVPGNNNMPLIVVINLPGSLPVCVSKGPLARPPPPRGEAGRGRPRRGRAGLIRANVRRARLPGGRGWPAKRRAGGERRTVTALTRIAPAGCLSNARPGRAGRAELTGLSPDSRSNFRPEKGRQLREFEPENG
jgi:hypothetical protein